MSTTNAFQSDLTALADYSRRIGRDPQLVQAAGGNTSFKQNGTMWIKASGHWLAHMSGPDGFVAVDLARLETALARPEATDPDMIACTCDPDPGKRPSVEVPMHAVLPQTYVIHSHPVAVLAFVIRDDAQAALAEALGDLDYVFVPYIKPGVPLARYVADHAGAQVFLLAGHGLIIAADSIAEADALQNAVLSRLPMAPNVAATSRSRVDLSGTGYHWAQDAASHEIAENPSWTAHMSGGSFAPDFLVFLGPALPVFDPTDATWQQGLNRLAQAPLPLNAVIVVAGMGVALRDDALGGTEELLRCARDVLAQLPPEVRIAYFSDDARDALLNWDAEKYRQALNTSVA